MLEKDQQNLDSDQDLIYSVAVLEFVAVSNEYCKFLENSAHFSLSKWVEKAVKILPLLYFKAASISDFENLGEFEPEGFVNQEDWEFIKEGISKKLGIHDNFIDVNNLQSATSETMSMSISECLADTYQDIKDFVSSYQLGISESIHEALWDCKENFKQIWGFKILATLTNLHFILHSPEGLEENEAVAPKSSKSQKKNWVNHFFEPTDNSEFF
jgi:hypothetical protein